MTTLWVLVTVLVSESEGVSEDNCMDLMLSYNFDLVSVESTGAWYMSYVVCYSTTVSMYVGFCLYNEEEEELPLAAVGSLVYLSLGRPYRQS